MYKYMKPIMTVQKIRSEYPEAVNPIHGGVCFVTDVDAFDFSDFDDTLDYQFESSEAYHAWMERYYES